MIQRSNHIRCFVMDPTHVVSHAPPARRVARASCTMGRMTEFFRSLDSIRHITHLFLLGVEFLQDRDDFGAGEF